MQALRRIYRRVERSESVIASNSQLLGEAASFVFFAS